MGINVIKERQLEQNRELDQSIEKARLSLCSHQSDDGYWCYELEADCTIPSEYILMMHFMDEIDTVLQSLLNYLTSSPARILAIIAIIAVGYSTLYLGKLPKNKAISVVIGIGIIFGAAAMLKLLGVGE